MLSPVTRRTVLLLGVSLALLSCTSCSSDKRKVYPVRGKVLCDGQPAEGADVTLYALDASDPMKEFPRARVKADGSFAIGTYAPEDGAPPGEYKVVIVWLPPDAGDRLLPSGRYPNKLPDLYSSVTTTPLKVQVKEGPNDLPPYELRSAKGARR